MVDIAQANWNVVRIVYGFLDPTMEMVNKERNCLFHWIQSLEIHTKQLISLEYQDQQHKRFCYEYKNVASLQKTNVQYVVIWCW
jgi:hypothetical protein